MQRRLQQWLKVPTQDPQQLQHFHATLQNLHDRLAVIETQQTTSPTAETVVPQGMMDDTALATMPDAHLGAQ